MTEQDISAVNEFARVKHDLGMMYFSGQGVKQDYKKAGTLFRAAGKNGFALSQAKLALMYNEGLGVVKDFDKSSRWLERAINSGEPLAIVEIALMHADDKDENKDKLAPYFYFDLAIDYGYKPAIAMRDSYAKTMSVDEIKQAKRITKNRRRTCGPVLADPLSLQSHIKPSTA